MAPYSNIETNCKVLKSDEEIYLKNDDEICHHAFLDFKGVKEKEELQPLSSLKLRKHLAIFGIYYTITAGYGLYLAFTAAKWQTLIFTLVLDALAIIGAMAGAHRLWSHRTYKATTTLKIILATFFTLTLQHRIYEFVQDHRVHHKYSDTDADPHNINRGFLYSHFLWIWLDKTEACKKRTAEVDMSDLDADPVVQFQKKYYYILGVVIAMVIPTLIPMFLWNETFLCAYCIATQLRIFLTYQQIFSINSITHMWGYRPYDKNIFPTENVLVAFYSGGEGFHNYHHAFPWDYSASEFGTKYNLSTAFINLMAWLGLAYDLKTVSKPHVEARKLRTGDKSLNQPKYEAGIKNGPKIKLTKKD